MLYQMRIYQAVRENLPVFHDFFRAWLLPVQLRHGARLVGRWETEDGRVVAITEQSQAVDYCPYCLVRCHHMKNHVPTSRGFR